MTLRQFDDRVAASIGRLPKELMTPFRFLGWVSAPLCWAGILFAVYTVDSASLTPLLVISLIPLSGVMKLLVRRARPAGHYAESQRIDTYSFPSSHTYSATVAGGYMALVLLGASLPWVSCALIGLIGLIGVSRVFIGAHYPSDVIGGWVLGVVVIIALNYVT